MVRSRRWARALIGCGLASLAATACTGSGGDESGPHSMTVLDTSTGEERWHLASTKDRFNGVGIGSSLVVGARVRCEEGPTPRVEAYDLESGDRRWSRKTLSFPITEPRLLSAQRDADIAAAGVIVTTGVTPQEQVEGLDAATGKVRWRIGLPEKLVGTSDTLVFTRRVDAEPRNTLRAFDRRTGRERWTFPVTAETGHTDIATVAADAETVVVMSGPPNSGVGPNPLGPTTFLVLDAATGRERLRFPSENPADHFSDFAIVDGALVFAEQSDVLARDLTDGSLRWRHHTDAALPPFTAGAPAIRIAFSSDLGTIFTDSYDQPLEVLDARTGAVRWSKPSRAEGLHRADGSTALLQVVDPDAVGPGQHDRDLVARNTTNGEPRWQATVERLMDTGRAFDFDVHARDGTAVVNLACPDN